MPSTTRAIQTQRWYERIQAHAQSPMMESWHWLTAAEKSWWEFAYRAATDTYQGFA